MVNTVPIEHTTVLFSAGTSSRRRGCSLAAISAVAAALLVSGCAKRPDVAGTAAELTGIRDAIVFRDHAEPLDGGGVAPSTLPAAQAVRLAMAHDPRVQSALAHVRIAEADANQARLLPNPIVSIDTRFPTVPGSNIAFEATLSGDLVALLQKPSQIGAADKRLRGAASDAVTIILDVIAEVQSAYATAVTIDAQITNATARQKNLQHLRDISQKRFEVGEAARLDVTTLDAQLMQANLDLADVTLQRTEQRLILARMTGQVRGTIEWTLEPLPDTVPAGMAPEDQWVDAALEHRPEIVSKSWELRALGDDLSSTALAPFLGGEIGAHAERDPIWRIGPTYTTPLPIFDWGQASHAKVQAQRIAARHDLEQLQLTVVQETRLAYATYHQSLQTLSAAQGKLLPLLHQQLDQSQRAYQVGDIDLATLLLAENEFQLAVSRIVTLQQNVVLAQIKLYRATGGAAVAGHLTSPPTSTPAMTAPAGTPATQPATGSAP